MLVLMFFIITCLTCPKYFCNVSKSTLHPVSIQVIIGSLHMQDTDQQQSEVALWRRLAQEKSRELEGFRLELDSILDVLKHLQSAGWREAPPTHRQNH